MPKGIKGFQKGHTTSEETRDKMRLKKLGKKRPNIVGHPMYKDSTRNEKISKNNTGKKVKLETREKMSKSHLKRYANKVHVSDINVRIRSSFEYKLWRTAVFERDNYTCIWCGFHGSKGILNADHIKPFAYFPELRFAIDNGRTLCLSCHKTTDTFAGKSKNKKY